MSQPSSDSRKGGLLKRLASLFRGGDAEADARGRSAAAPAAEASVSPSAASPSAPAQLRITPEPTPNPNSTKFTVNRRLVDGPGRTIERAAAAETSPLAAKLYARQEITGVYIGAGFVTVTAEENVNWFDLADFITDTMRQHLESGAPVVAGAVAENAPFKSYSEVEAGIIDILNNEIRPAVAMDGGDIVFAGFEDGVVLLHLRGSCHGCPSSLMTLKMGIERRLKEEFPEVIAVEAV